MKSFYLTDNITDILLLNENLKTDQNVIMNYLLRKLP